MIAPSSRKIFNSPSEKERLERYIHPIVNQQRERLMMSKANDPTILAYVWDTPLLFETDLNKLCDAVVFVAAPARIGWPGCRVAAGMRQSWSGEKNRKCP